MSQNSGIAVDKLRPHTQRLWQSLTVDERREFLERDAALWNVTRHRIALPVHNKVTDALDAGRLRIVAGTIQSLEPGEQFIDVVLRDAKGEPFRQSADLVINCTGPQARLSQSGTPLYDNMIERGLVTCDELDMGIQVNESFAVVGRDGLANSSVYAIGPPLKGSLWETTAVPELRSQAMRVAEVILEREPVAVADENIIEYYI